MTIFKSIYRKALVWLTETKAYKWLLLHVIPFVRFSMYYTTIRGWKYHRGYARLEPGHIILTKDNNKLTTLLIGGEFTHAALCVGINSESKINFEIAEMTHHNYTKSHFFDLCKEADRVVILECTDFDSEYVEQMIEKCLTFQDAAYDTEFSLGVQALYCSELVYQADFERRLKVDLSDLAGLGREYISPTGLYQAKNVVVVWDSEGEVPPKGFF